MQVTFPYYNLRYTNSMDIGSITPLGFFGSIMLAWAIIMLGLTVCLVIWGLSIWHVIHFKDVPNRTMWIVAIIFIPLIGSVIYYFFIMLPYNRAHPYIRPNKSPSTSSRPR
jgi:hypothetical protein